MSVLYILGGPPRTAKTTIMMNLLAKTPVQFVAADAVEYGMRNMLTGEPHQMLHHIEIHGSAEYKTSIAKVGEGRRFSSGGTESEMTLKAIMGMLDYYSRNNHGSVAFEGAAFTPAWVSKLCVPGFTVRAAFVGFTNHAHAEAIIAHAKENSRDWINEWLAQERGDDTKVREWVARQVERCLKLKDEAEAYGYPFFDISTTSFEEYLAAVVHYFLEGRIAGE